MFLKGRKKILKGIFKLIYLWFLDFIDEKNDNYNKCKKRPWTEEEDKLVIKLVRENGPHKCI
jgi:hypothetical protein